MPEFRGQLTTAAATRRSRGPLRRGASAAPAAAAVLIALAVAAGAVLALRHQSRTGPATGAGVGRPPTVSTARKQLRAQLGVLRRGRPQTSRTIIPLIFRPDAAVPKGSCVANHTKLDRPLARAVRLGEYGVGVLPAT